MSMRAGAGHADTCRAGRRSIHGRRVGSRPPHHCCGPARWPHTTHAAALPSLYGPHPHPLTHM